MTEPTTSKTMTPQQRAGAYFFLIGMIVVIVGLGLWNIVAGIIAFGIAAMVIGWASM